MPDTFTTAVHIVGLMGLVLVVTRGNIAIPIRKLWPDMLGCAMCFGVWAGVAGGAYHFCWYLLPAWVRIAGDAVLFGFAISILSWSYGLWSKFYELQNDYTKFLSGAVHPPPK